MAQHNFQVSGLTLPEGNDLFGVWQVPSPAAPGVSFDVSAPAPEPTWRIALPASLQEAQSILSEQAHAIQRGEQALEQAQARLAQVSQRGTDVSFAAPTAGPEAALISSLGALESPISFGLLGGEDKEQQIRDQWKSFLAQISNMVSHYARVETEIAGALVGHTAIGWTGDFNTIWKQDVTTPSMRLHHQSVHLALASRLALLRMVVVVGTGAANLAVKLSIPGAQLLVLPAAWRFVQDVLREMRNWKEQA